eukprot:COSAG05_NODE_209_length_14039_cov_138.574892_10_plen_112_part_00
MAWIYRTFSKNSSYFCTWGQVEIEDCVGSASACQQGLRAQMDVALLAGARRRTLSILWLTHSDIVPVAEQCWYPSPGPLALLRTHSRHSFASAQLSFASATIPTGTSQQKL